jgi:imidazolonepropionase-like amidohydrolase
MAMTFGAARACGIADQVGSLEPGKRADVVVVDGSPVDDIRRLGNLLFIMKDGAIVLGGATPS